MKEIKIHTIESAPEKSKSSLEKSFNNEELTVVWQTINVEHEYHYCVPANTGVANMMKIGPAITEVLRNSMAMPTEKYGSSIEDQKESKRKMAEFGAELGFKFDYFDTMKIVNTRDAHVLLDYAKEEGKQTGLNLRYVAAFFGERKDVSDRNILIQELEKVGLDKNIALARLESGEAREKIIEEESNWQNMGVSSVPTFVFNRKSALSGAQPKLFLNK